MSAENEPEAKKRKESQESDDVPPMNFVDPETAHDRVLLVEGKKFYIESELLAKHSEFFRAMFTSDFAEKEKKEIELDGVSAEDFEDFLLAISNPESYIGDKNKLVALIKTCSYLMAIPTLMEILTVLKCFKQECIHINYATLLELAQDNGIVEIRKRVEEGMVLEYFESGAHFSLAIKYKLNNLLDHIEKMYLDGDLFELKPTQELIEMYREENTEYFLKRIENFENKYIQTLRNSSADVLHKNYALHVSYAYVSNLVNLANTIGEIVSSAFEKSKENGRISRNNLDSTLEFSKHNKIIEAYVCKYLEEDFTNNNTIANIEYIFIRERFSGFFEFRLPTFQKFLAKTFHGRAPNDPLFTENEEAFDELSSEARAFIFNCMRKDPSFLDGPRD